MSLIAPKTALVSLSDKSNLDELIKFLLDQEVKIISTGGTYNAIKKITDKVEKQDQFANEVRAVKTEVTDLFKSEANPYYNDIMQRAMKLALKKWSEENKLNAEPEE